MYQFTRVSSNTKTGPIPTTMTKAETCPESCPLKGNGCYAENFPMSLHWEKSTNLSIDGLVKEIKKLPKGQLWRHNVAGDLPGEGETIDRQELIKIVAANKNKRGFTYTHKPINRENLNLIGFANARGFTVNASANNIDQADYYFDLGLPTVCVLPSNATEKSYQTEQGNTVVTCPAAINANITCATCGICQNADRSFIVGFPAHGARKKKANEIACENI